MKFEAFTGLSRESQRAQLLTCCGSERWADTLLHKLPVLTSEQALLDAAERVFLGLSEEDWLQAFSHHPRIGDRAQLAARFGKSGELSQGEQAGVDGAASATIDALAECNEAYFERFGFVFLICATGKSAQEMLSALRARIGNSRPEELRNAAAEQVKITALRLLKL